MPAFSTYLQRPDMSAIFVLRISGIPLLFSNAKIPTRWSSTNTLTYNGEDYTWVPALDISEGVSVSTTKIEPKGGVGQSTGMDFNIVTVGYQSGSYETDPTLSVLLNNTNRTDSRYVASLKANLDADVSGPGTDLFFIYNPWESSGIDFLYLGTETIKIESITNNKADNIESTVTRGCFGSMPQDHIGEVYDATSVQGGNMYVADYPLTMEGRYAELWMVPGEFHTDANGKPFFIPFADGLADSDNQLVYAGLVDGTHEDGMIVTFRTSSLDQMIKGNVMAMCPTAKINAARKIERFYLGPHNWWISFDIQTDSYTFAPVIAAKSHTDITAGDTITICGIPIIEGTHWNKLGDLPAAYGSIVAAINAHVVLNTLVSAFLVDGVISVHPRSYLGATNTITFTQTVAGNLYSSSSNFEGQNGFYFLNVRLVKSDNNDGQAPYSDVIEAEYSLSQLEQILKDTINSRIPPPIRVTGIFTYGANEGDKPLVEFAGSIQPAIIGKVSTLTFITQQGSYSSFLRDLGFTDLEYTADKDSNDDYAQFFKVSASRSPAVLRIPSEEFMAPQRIYLDDVDKFARDNFAIAAGWKDRFDVDIPKFMRIKEVGIFNFDSMTTSAYGQRYLTSVTRASTSYGYTKPEEYYLEANQSDDKQIEVERLMALSGQTSNISMLYIMLSSARGTNHAKYDRGWPGCGLGIPARFVDTASFERLNTEYGQVRDTFLILPNDAARTIMDEELKSTQQQIVADLGKIYLTEMMPTLEGIPKTTITVDPSSTTTNPDRGIGVDRQTNRIVNIVEVNGAYDYNEEKYYLNQINRKQDSIGTWGQKEKVVINLRGLANTVDGESRGKAIAQQLFAIYSQPYAIIDVDIAVKDAWLYRLGDEVLLSHPLLPHPTEPRRSAENLPCKIVGKKMNFFGSEKEFVTLNLMSWALFGNRYTIWAPSALLTYGGSPAVWNISEADFGNLVNGVYTSDYFQIGYRVRSHPVGSASIIHTATIVNRTGTPPGVVQITLSSSPGSTFNRIMTYGLYSDGSLHDDQRKVAYMSEYLGTLQKSSGTDPAFKYL